MNGYETLGGRYVDHLAMMVMTPFNGNEPFGGMSLDSLTKWEEAQN